MDDNTDPKTSQTPKIKPAKPAKPAQATPKQPAGNNGEVPPGGVNPNDRSEEQDVTKTPAPSAPNTTILNVTLNDAARNDGTPVGGRAVPRGNGRGRPGDPWGTRAELEERRERQHQINLQNQVNERARLLKIGETARAKYEARRAAQQEAINNGDFSSLTSISADTWKTLGQRNGQIRTEYEKNKEDNSLIPDGKGGYKTKAFENGGAMFDAAKGAADIQKLEKWWAEEGVATSAKFIPKGVFDENGKLKTDGLTADQVGALQKIMENSQARLAPIRQRAELNNAQNYLNASEYLSKKGVKVWDTATGQRLLSKDQVMQMAHQMRLGDAREALKGMGTSWAKAQETPVDSTGKPFTDKKDIDFYQRKAFGQAQADEASLVAKMRDLGFRADQIADDSGRIDYNRIAQALAGAQVAEVTPKETPKPAPKTPTTAQGEPAIEQGNEDTAKKRAALFGKVAQGFEKSMGVETPEINLSLPLPDTTPEIVKPPKPETLDELRARSADPLAAVGKALAEPKEAEWQAKAPERAKARKAAAEAQAKREAEILAEIRARTPVIQARNPRAVPILSRTAYRDLVSGRGGQGDADMFLGNAAQTALESAALGSLGRMAGAARTGITGAAQKSAARAVARVASHPGTQGAIREAEKVAGMSGAQRTMRAIDQMRQGAPSAVARRNAMQKAADIRKANKAVEAAKSGAEKTSDAVSRFQSRVSAARPRRGSAVPKAKGGRMGEFFEKAKPKRRHN